MRYFNLIFLLIFTRAVIASNGPFVFPKISCEQFWKTKKINPQKLSKKDYEHYYKQIKRNKCFKEWSVLVYMAADNDLSPYSLGDIYEMEQKIKGEKNLGATTVNTDVLVELDTFMRSGVRRLHIYQTEKPYDLNANQEDWANHTEENISSPVIRIYNETGRGSLINQKHRFRRFLRWGMRSYPAKHYMVVIWGHGEGFIGKHHEKAMRRQSLPEESRATSRYLSKKMVYLNLGQELSPTKFPIDKVFGGVAFDHSDYSFLDIPTINQIITETTSEFFGGKKLDILAFDACLMQTVEVAQELEKSTRYLIGSVQIQNYVGLPYRKILDRINNNSPTPYQLAKEIPSLADESFKNGYQQRLDPEGHRTFTLSSIITSELKNQLIPSLIDFSKSLKEYLDEDFMRVMEINFILENGQSFRGETRDLGTFLGSIKRLIYEESSRSNRTYKAQKLLKKLNATLDAINRTMLSYAYGSGYTDQRDEFNQNYLLGFFKGLSIWIPNNYLIFSHRKSEFSQSRLYQTTYLQTSWNTWFPLVFSEI